MPRARDSRAHARVNNLPRIEFSNQTRTTSLVPDHGYDHCDGMNHDSFFNQVHHIGPGGTKNTACPGTK